MQMSGEQKILLRLQEIFPIISDFQNYTKCALF